MVSNGHQMERGRTFDEVAELYDRARPRYPEALFDDLSQVADLDVSSRVLEIGCGTGKATLSMADRGYDVTAIELGPRLVAVARRNLSGFRNVRVHIGAFEDWSLPDNPFDLVMAATSFGWVDRTVRYSKSAQALKAKGWLAVFDNRHVAGGDNAFFDAVQACYERFMPGTPPGLKLPDPSEIRDNATELEATRLFGAPEFRRYYWEQRYTTAEYLDVLSTYSGHILLSRHQRGALFDCITELIESKFDGAIRKAYLTHLLVAHKV